MSVIHVLYWRDLEGKPNSQEHQTIETLMKASEALRRGGMARFICSTTEDSNMVGKMGTDQVGPDYNWYKRRPDPTIPLGRPTKEKS